jgi:hypothetical protein
LNQKAFGIIDVNVIALERKNEQDMVSLIIIVKVIDFIIFIAE